MIEKNPVCPHCNQITKRMEIPEETHWEAQFLYVCFNDECPFFVNGWEWMREHNKVSASYRYRVDPQTGSEGPFPVWSIDAMKNKIIE